jgi:molybdate transport system regulatory protein
MVEPQIVVLDVAGSSPVGHPILLVPKGSNKRSSVVIRARIRILHGDDIAIGPGKAELLEFVRQTGSIAEAAKQMGMSYMRAWTLIKTMNACFKEPLVEAVRGGRAHGGAVLTETGRKALRLYQQMEADCLKSTTTRWKELRSLMRG